MFKFERLKVWRESVLFAKEIIKLCEKIPQKLQFSLGEQIRRAVISVSSNIAEATGREGIKQSRYLFSVAKGSLYETVSLLIVMKQQGIIGEVTFAELYRTADEIAKMLSGLLKNEKE